MELFFQSQLWVGLNVIALLVALVVFKIRPLLAFAAIASLLFLTSTISQSDYLTGFTNSALVTLVLLLTCSFAIEKTTFIRKIGNVLSKGQFISNYLKLLVCACVTSSVTNNTAVVATLMASIKQSLPNDASRYLLPLSYASIVGGTLTLVGTSTNLIVASFVESAALMPLSLFSTTPVAIWVVLACLLTLVCIIPLLPKTNSQNIANTNAYFLEAKVNDGSTLVGNTVFENGFRDLGSLFLAEIIRGDKLISPIRPSDIIEAGDRLLFSGDLKDVATLGQFDKLHIVGETSYSNNLNLVEVIVLHQSSLLGKTIKTAQFRARFNASVVGVKRGSQTLSGGLGKVVISAGDVLLLAVGSDFKTRKNLKRNFIILNDDFANNLLSKKASILTLLGFVTVLGLAVFNVLPLLKGLLLLLASYIGLGLISVQEIRRRLPFEIAIVVGCALAIASAVYSSGLATTLSNYVLLITSEFGVYGAFVGVFFVSLLLTELITNNAAAALVFPIALSVANSFGVEPMPFIMAVAFGASASFLTPYGYQTNLMVYSAGQYQFKDYLKLGLPVSIVYSIAALYVIPIIYPF